MVVCYALAQGLTLGSVDLAVHSLWNDSARWVRWGIGLGVGLVPWWLSLRSVDVRGARRTIGITIVCAIWSALGVLPEGLLVVHWFERVAVGLGAVFVLDLGLDRPGLSAFANVLYLRVAAVLALCLLTLAAVLAEGPLLMLFGVPTLVPMVWSSAAHAGFVASCVLALGIRGWDLRRTAKSEPRVRDAWVFVGLALAVVALLTSALLSTSTAPMLFLGEVKPWLSVWGGLSLVVGHVMGLESGARLNDGRQLSRAASWGVSFAVVSLLAGRLWGGDKLEVLWLWCVGLLVAAWWVQSLVFSLFVRWFAPWRVRLLNAVHQVWQGTHQAVTLEDLAERALVAFRKAAREADAQPLLLCVDPPALFRIQGTGKVVTEIVDHRVVDGDQAWMGRTPLSFLEKESLQVVLRSEVERRHVREPGLRDLWAWMQEWNAQCILPLWVQGELEGALVVPRGRRRSPLRHDEVEALRGLAHGLGVRVFAHQRALRLTSEISRLHRERDGLRDELDLLSQQSVEAHLQNRDIQDDGAWADIRVEPTAYDDGSRVALDKVLKLGESGVPIWLEMESFLEARRWCYRLHQHGGASGPLVFVDCAAFNDGTEESGDSGLEAWLLGDGSRPGRVVDAEGGTLVLLNSASIPRELHPRLIELMVSRRVTGPTGSRTVDVRLVWVSSPGGLPTAWMEDPLRERLASTLVVVPDLACRPRDLESMLLQELECARRRLGRAPMGFTQAALEKLKQMNWPGGLDGIRAWLQSHLPYCSGDRVTLDNIQIRGDAPEVGASYDDLERRILERALEQNGGNKSQAARALGLKRSTFHDKLKRFGIQDSVVEA